MMLPASAAWMTMLLRRRRRVGLRRAFVTASLDVVIVMWAVWVSLLVTMPTANPGSVHLVPGTDLLVAAGDREAFWQLTANFSLLLPLGMLLPARWVWWRSTRRVTVAAFTTSCGIELTQYIAAVGRVTSTDDVLVNTAGATAGASLTLWIIHRRQVPQFTPVVAPVGVQPGPRSAVWAVGSRTRGVDPVAVPGPRLPRTAIAMPRHANTAPRTANTATWNADTAARNADTATWGADTARV
ncbi:hypothetical protein BJF85_08005 [Saccharomonospora sp. CUA-673]|nr:hypothetical protein BJF85_08005 [Saccharomonospora sp. CUA-673]